MTLVLDFDGLRQKLIESSNLAGPLLTIPDPSLVETLLYTNPDMIIVDMEHSAISVENLYSICMASGNTPVLARVRGLEKNEIKRVLEAGVHGIIIPGIENVDDARASVQYSRFPPEGKRGVGPGRASGYTREMGRYLSGRPLVFVQIETAGAFEEVQNIGEVRGIDGLFIGPFDLSIALGIEFSWENQNFVKTVNKIKKTAKSNNLLTGIYSPMSGETLKRVAREGFNFLMLGMDREAIFTGYKDALTLLRTGFAQS